MRPAPNAPRIGVALGGGAAQGFAHIPVLEAIDSLGLKPVAIAGTSMGAVIGAVYAAGMSGAEIRDYSVRLFGNRTELLARLWQLRPRRLSDISFGIGAFDLEKALRALLPPAVPEDFSGLAMRFAAVATDYYSGDEMVLTEGPLIPAIAASAAVPMLFRPVIVGGRVMIDGGVCNPVPFDALGDVDLIVASDVISGPRGDQAIVPGPMQAAFGSVSLVLKTVLAQKMKQARPPDLVVRPPTGSYHILDFTKAEAIIREGDPAKDEVRRGLGEALEAFVRAGEP